MEKKRTGNGKFKVFLKKNIYYIIMAICLLAIAAMITVTLITKNNAATPDDPGTPVGPSVDDNLNKDPDPVQPDPPVDNKDPDPVIPTPTPVVFVSPVNDCNVTNDFAMDSLIWHNTLKHYAAHGGIDFAGNDGDNVMSVYSGTVTDVSYDILNGYVVTVKHNDNLTTKYASLNEPSVVVGQTVAKGEIIGTMGTTATNEYLDGAHVHFSLYENGEIADPYNYLTLGNK